MEYLEDFVDYLYENDKSEYTIKSYKKDLEQFYSILGSDIENITKRDIRVYIRELKNRNLNIKTINRKLTSLSQYIKFLNEEMNLKISVTIKNQKIQSQEYLEDMLSKEDFNKLISFTHEREDYRAKALFCTLYYTGMRVSEMLQLKVTDCQKDRIQIRGKGGKYRNIFIPEKLHEVWEKYIVVRKEKGEYLFTGSKGVLTRIGVHKIIKKYADLANINPNVAHAHNFRHLFCLSMVEKGFSLDVVADLAGHSNINTTRIYTRKTTKELVNAINEL